MKKSVKDLNKKVVTRVLNRLQMAIQQDLDQLDLDRLVRVIKDSVPVGTKSEIIVLAGQEQYATNKIVVFLSVGPLLFPALESSTYASNELLERFTHYLEQDVYGYTQSVVILIDNFSKSVPNQLAVIKEIAVSRGLDLSIQMISLPKYELIDYVIEKSVKYQ